MGPPIGNVTFFGLKEINFDPPIEDATLFGQDFHGFCLVPIGFERVSWFLMVSGWFSCFLKVVVMVLRVVSLFLFVFNGFS